MEQDHDVDSYRDEERLQRDVETQNVSVDGQEERSECISILRQLLDDVDMNIVSKYSLIKQLEEECGEDLSSEYQAISEEIDAYIFTHRQSQSSSVSSNTSLDSFFLVEPALAKITGKQECSGKEILFHVWKYIHDHNRIRENEPQIIDLDDSLAFLSDKGSISIHEVTAMIRKHISLPSLSQYPDVPSGNENEVAMSREV
ncbi:hypothetical protein WA171_006466 [Blastocystis sp. BT1]